MSLLNTSALYRWLSAASGQSGFVDSRLSRILLDVDHDFFAILEDGPGLARIRDLATDYFQTKLEISSPICPSNSETDVAALVLALSVQSERNDGYVDHIQQMSRDDQEDLMKIIEKVSPNIRRSSKTLQHRLLFYPSDETSTTDEDLDKNVDEENTLRKVYKDLLTTYSTLKRENEENLARLADLEEQPATPRASQSAFGSDDGQTENAYKAEIDRLQANLLKTENELAETEASLTQQSKRLEEAELSLVGARSKVEEAERVKDQLDEFKHAAEKLARAENVIEKYKRKMEESADLRRTAKALEDENADLVNANARLQEQASQTSGFKPTLEAYKSKQGALEMDLDELRRQNESMAFQLSQMTDRLQIAEEERDRDAEAVVLYEERLREMELGPNGRRQFTTAVNGDGFHSSDSEDGPDDSFQSSTATMTDLRLQVKRLERELHAAKNSTADASRLLVVENLLEDAERMRKKYEVDYLGEHRQVLQLQHQLEEIASGKNDAHDGPEIVLALRQRLHEATTSLDSLQREHSALEQQLSMNVRDLTVARSDLDLVNKDQLDVIASLRSSVEEEKKGLSDQVSALRNQIDALQTQHKMQASQINSLLMDKIDLQSDSIDQRQRMLDRDHTFEALKQAMNGQASDATKSEYLDKIKQDMKAKETDLAIVTDKLEQARIFIRQQDTLARQKYMSLSANSGEAEQLKARIKELEDELQRQKTAQSQADLRSRREQELMVQSWQQLSFDHLRNRSQSTAPTGSATWLVQQVANNDFLNRA